MKHPPSSRQREREFRRARRAGPPESPALFSIDTGKFAEARRHPDKSRRRHYRRQYTNWLWPHRFTLLTVLLLALIAAALDIAWPIAIKVVIDVVDSVRPYAQKLHLLNLFGLLILVLLVSKQATDTIRSYRTLVLNHKVVFRLRRALFERLLHLPLGELGNMKSGGIASRLSSDVESVSGLIQQALISPTIATLRIVITISVLFWFNWKMAVAAIVVLPPLTIGSLIWLRRIRPVYRSALSDRTNIDARVNETFGGVRVVRSFRREPHEERSYAVSHHTIIRKLLFAQRMELSLEAVWGVVIPLTMLTIVWYGSWLHLHGQAGLGDIFLFNICLAQLLQPVYMIVSSVSQTQRSLAAMERVFEAMEMPLDKPDRPGAVDAPSSVSELRFENVQFSYRAGAPVIREFSLTVPGGSMVALVGPSGAGKTTLTDLVARFHDPDAGRVLLNGIDLRHFRLQSYRSLLAVVPQEVFLFDGTVGQNIAYGRRGASDAEIESAARRANAHDFVQQLPQGYDTIVGERGFKLSGGQRQRLSIARAILADPQILILDEATSNLDTESEQLIQAALSDLLRHRTTFVIAHRLSTVTHADLIVAMEGGRIRESGTHAELMCRRGLYHEMVERQRQSFDSFAAAG